jgi:hypothetical protein
MRALLLGVLVLALLPAPASASIKSIWGPNDLPNGRSAFPTYERLGVDVLQRQLQWWKVATSRPADPQNPDDPAYAWPEDLDQAAARARRHHIRLALLVKGSPWWSNGGDFWRTAPDDPGDYANFLVAAARRYPDVRLWMIWGEPTQSDRWQPKVNDSRQAGARAYAVLLDRAYAALKQQSADNKVIGGMTWTLGGTVLPTDWVRWMRLPNGRPPRLDWFGHNPFTTRFPNLRRPVYHKGLRDFSDIDTYVKEVRRAYRRTGRRPRLWLSEFTVSSDRDNKAFNFHVSRRQQARWLTAAYRIARRTPYVAGLGWFKLLDEPDDDGLTTGLMTAKGKRKPAFYAYRRAR